MGQRGGGVTKDVGGAKGRGHKGCRWGKGEGHKGCRWGKGRVTKNIGGARGGVTGCRSGLLSCDGFQDVVLDANFLTHTKVHQPVKPSRSQMAQHFTLGLAM